LTKRFGGFTAVDRIDFDLFRGGAFGFLGPNGAGKSSTMRMLGCVSPPTNGDLIILGGDPVKHGAAIRARHLLAWVAGFALAGRRFATLLLV
jgi:lipooligosaccharide transport system ATP-binding protein